MSFSRHMVSPLTPQAAPGANAQSVEAMFSQIMEVVLKSVSAARCWACLQPYALVYSAQRLLSFVRNVPSYARLI